MSFENISDDNLLKLYNLSKRRLNCTFEEFKKDKITSKKMYTLYNDFVNFYNKIVNDFRFTKFKQLVITEFGKDNFNVENCFVYYIDRYRELDKSLDAFSKDNINNYCLKSRKDRKDYISFVNSQNNQYKVERVSEMYRLLLVGSDIDKKRLLDVTDNYLETERNVLFTLALNDKIIMDILDNIDSKRKERLLKRLHEKAGNGPISKKVFYLYLYENFLMTDLINKSCGEKIFDSNDIYHILRVSLDADFVSEIYDVLSSDKSNTILKGYRDLKNNDEFLSRFPNRDDKQRTSLRMIKSLDDSYKEMSTLNGYMGFFSRLDLTKYTLSSDEQKKEYNKVALSSYKKKVLKDSKENISKFISSIPLFEKLRDVDKNNILDNYKVFISGLFDTALSVIDKLDYMALDDLIKYVGSKVIETIMISVVKKTDNIDRVDYIEKNKEENVIATLEYSTLKLHEEYEVLRKQVDDRLKEEEERIRQQNEVFNNFNKQMDDIWNSHSQMMADNARKTIIEFEKMMYEERIKNYQDEFIKRFNEEHLNYFDGTLKFYQAMKDLIKLYENKTGDKFNPEEGFKYSYEDILKYASLSEEEKMIYESEINFPRNNKGNTY